jgi:CspA family cold shock protein
MTNGLEASGRVKWFDATKGYGFLVCDGLDRDVLVHFSALREHGIKSVPEGAVLDVVASETERGLQVEKVLAIDLRSAVPPRIRKTLPRCADKTSAKPHGEPGDWQPLEVKWFDSTRGFGFLAGDTDAFLHASVVRVAGLRGIIAPGDWVEARLATTERGLIAVEIRACADAPEALAA